MKNIFYFNVNGQLETILKTNYKNKIQYLCSINHEKKLKLEFNDFESVKVFTSFSEPIKMEIELDCGELRNKTIPVDQNFYNHTLPQIESFVALNKENDIIGFSFKN